MENSKKWIVFLIVLVVAIILALVVAFILGGGKTNIQPQQLQMVSDKSEYIGNYKFTSSSVTSNLEVNQIGDDGAMQFQIVVGEKSGCTGATSGSAVISGNKATFNSDTCNLEFEMYKSEIIVKEVKACTNDHGPTCDFNGTYKKEQI